MFFCVNVIKILFSLLFCTHSKGRFNWGNISWLALYSMGYVKNVKVGRGRIVVVFFLGGGEFWSPLFLDHAIMTKLMYS